MQAGLADASIDDIVAGQVRRATAIAQGLTAQAQEGIKQRIVAHIQNVATADDAAFDVAKDGEAALRALTGAAAAERRRILANGGGGAAVAVAVAVAVGKQ